jgi:hypothetical protein
MPASRIAETADTQLNLAIMNNIFVHPFPSTYFPLLIFIKRHKISFQRPHKQKECSLHPKNNRIQFKNWRTVKMYNSRFCISHPVMRVAAIITTVYRDQFYVLRWSSGQLKFWISLLVHFPFIKKVSKSELMAMAIPSNYWTSKHAVA